MKAIIGFNPMFVQALSPKIDKATCQSYIRIEYDVCKTKFQIYYYSVSNVMFTRVSLAKSPSAFKFFGFFERLKSYNVNISHFTVVFIRAHVHSTFAKV